MPKSASLPRFSLDSSTLRAATSRCTTPAAKHQASIPPSTRLLTYLYLQDTQDPKQHLKLSDCDHTQAAGSESEGSLAGCHARNTPSPSSLADPPTAMCNANEFVDQRRHSNELTVTTPCSLTTLSWLNWAMNAASRVSSSSAVASVDLSCLMATK